MLDELLRLHAVALGLEQDLLGELVLIDLGLPLIGDRVEQQLGLHRLLGLLAGLGVPLLASLALRLEELCHLLVVVPECVHDLMLLTLDLFCDDLLRQRDLDLGEQLLEDLVADRVRLLHLLGLLDPVDKAVAQLGDGVELAGHLGELVVEFGQFTFLDRVHGDRHLRLLARVVSGDQRGGELLRFAGLDTDQGLVEALDELTGTDLMRQTLGRSLLDGLAVDGCRQVDGDEVALLRATVDTLECAEARTQPLDLLIDLGVIDLDGVDLDREGRVFRQLDLRADVDLGGERDGTAVDELGEINLGLADRLGLGLCHGLRVLARQRVVDHLGEDRVATDASLDQLGGRLARTKARDTDLLGQRTVGPVELAGQLLERDFDIELHPGRAELLDGALHACSLHLHFCVGVIGLCVSVAGVPPPHRSG